MVSITVLFNYFYALSYRLLAVLQLPIETGARSKLMQDSNRYPDSMFYQPWSHPTQYSPIDKALIRMLYDDRVKAGMSREKVKEVFKGGQKSFN